MEVADAEVSSGGLKEEKRKSEAHRGMSPKEPNLPS